MVYSEEHHVKRKPYTAPVLCAAQVVAIAVSQWRPTPFDLCSPPDKPPPTITAVMTTRPRSGSSALHVIPWYRSLASHLVADSPPAPTMIPKAPHHLRRATAFAATAAGCHVQLLRPRHTALPRRLAR